MYFVDRKQLEDKLQYMEKCTELFQTTSSWHSELNELALERICHVVIEGVIDVGHNMIDGFIMRDPGSYEDIVDILHDEQVIAARDADMLKDMLSIRKQLVQHYDQVDAARLCEKMKQNMPALTAFPQKVRTYLKEELGPVSAFSPYPSEEA